jgi:CubicO group peptidase (beta-lactamase class C family)
VLKEAGPAWFRAGAGFAYSNTNYVILGLLIEKLTGQPVAEVLDERLFQPLGLTSAEMGTGIGAEGRPILQPAWATGFWTSGAMTSTARDLARWGADLYGGKVLDAASLTAMMTFTKGDYGLGVQRLVLDDTVAYGHSGLLSTYTSLLVHFPREQVTVAILANRAEVDLPSLLLYKDGGQPSLLDLALKAAPRP